MNKKWLILILSLFIFLIFYEIFSSSYSIFLIFLGLGSLFLKDSFSRKYQRLFLFIALLSFTFLFFSSRFTLMFLVLLILIFISKNPEVSALISSVFSNKRKNNISNDFIIIDFDQSELLPGKTTKNKWLGADTKSSDSIYSWEDVNFTKLIGNSVFDLGNTLLPREQNIILIRQAIGNVKILIPEGTAVSLDFSVLVGKVILNTTEHNLLNENFKWSSDDYHLQDRKLKIAVNLLVGELEVVFL